MTGVKNVEKLIVKIRFDIDGHFRRDKLRGGGNVSAVKKNYYIFDKIKKSEKIIPDIFIKDKEMTTEQIVKEILNKLI